MTNVHIEKSLEKSPAGSARGVRTIALTVSETYGSRSFDEIRAFARSVIHVPGGVGDALRRGIVGAAVDRGDAAFGHEIMALFEKASEANDAATNGVPELGEDFHPQDVGA